MITRSSHLYSHQQVDDHYKKKKPHHRTYNKQQKGKIEPKLVLSYNQIYFHSPIYIHHPSMLWPSNQYTKTRLDSTRLIRIHIIWSDSLDACTCGGYLCSPPSYVLQVLQWINPSHTRLALKWVSGLLLLSPQE